MRYLKILALAVAGSVLIGFGIDMFWFLLDANHVITLGNLWANINVSLVIGLISTLCVFNAMVLFRKKPLAGYLANFTVVALSFLVLYLLGKYYYLSDTGIAQWLAIFVFVEAVSSMFVYFVYRRNLFYNTRLERKKASLASEGGNK